MISSESKPVSDISPNLDIASNDQKLIVDSIIIENPNQNQIVV